MVVNLALAELVLTNSPWEFAPRSDEQPDSASAINPIIAIIFMRAPVRLLKCVEFASLVQVLSAGLKNPADPREARNSPARTSANSGCRRRLPRSEARPRASRVQQAARPSALPAPQPVHICDSASSRPMAW